MKYEKICVRIDSELKKDFAASCQSNYEDMSAVLTRAIVTYVRNYYVSDHSDVNKTFKG
jgi:hypothetical protein